MRLILATTFWVADALRVLLELLSPLSSSFDDVDRLRVQPT
jgi:hypothetical protein